MSGPTRAATVADVPAATATADADPAQLEEIVVTASLRRTPEAETAASTTVLGERVLRDAGLQHLGDVLALVPNLNWSGGSSRPRYFQLRGIGELEQYQGAPNPSVGFLIDGIDFSGVGMPATLFDVAQVEVLRGPQGTQYGANALAGLINVRSHAPESEYSVRTEASAGEDGIWSAGLQAGGPLTGDGERAAWRIAAQRFEGDGFRHDVFLVRDDTNRRDETTFRGKLRLSPSQAWRIDLTAMYVDLDNGYDAFAIDNSLTTRSDRPGQDAQRSTGASFEVDGDLGAAHLVSTSAYADSHIVYSFDGDWGNDAYWGDVAPDEYLPYDYFSRYERERRTLSQDLRFVSATTADTDGFGWVAGLYALRLDEDSRQRDDFAGVPSAMLVSDYSATSLAAYGEVDWQLRDGVILSTGLRAERRDATYDDSDGASFSPDDQMVGGHVSVRGNLSPSAAWYVTASRGYKAGGFNIGSRVPADQRSFAPEYLWNVETGLRYARDDGRFDGGLSLFHMWRVDQQVATSFQLDPGDPLTYVFLTDNAASGRNYGLEAHASWRPLRALTLQATLGLLESEYVDYHYVDPHYGDRNLDGRAQAHAPQWQSSLAAEWRSARGWMLRADVAATDAFYFDASHDQRSDAYALVNLKAGYDAGHWAVYAWGRNVFDENYAVRGFYFGLEPPDFADKLYVQRGDPRHLGLTVEWRLR